MASDYYETLGVAREADPSEIKKAFRRLARELHPDVNGHDPDAEAKFKQAAEAYEVLSDPERRATYDRFGPEGLRAGGWSSATSATGGIQDIFQAFFGGDPFGAQSGPAAADIAARIEVDLADLVAGTSRRVDFEGVVRCETCSGRGAAADSELVACEVCGGAGEVQRVSSSMFGRVISRMPCEECGGRGRIPEIPCPDCEGAGRVISERTWEVDVPAGIEDGQRIRISGAGNEGEPGTGDGDLFVEVSVRPDERFARRGTEVYVRAGVPVTTAMLGGEVEIETLEGTEPVEIPAGSRQGDEVVRKGHGLPPLGGGRRGDLHAVVELEVPRKLTRKQRQAAERLAEELE